MSDQCKVGFVQFLISSLKHKSIETVLAEFQITLIKGHFIRNIKNFAECVWCCVLEVCNCLFAYVAGIRQATSILYT